MLHIYSQDKIVVNIDESWIDSSDYRRRRWVPKGEDNSLAARTLGHKVNIIVAVSSEGHVWLSLTQCNTDENVMMMFLSRLSAVFASEFKGSWRDKLIILMDGASYHRSTETRACINHLGM